MEDNNDENINNSEESKSNSERSERSGFSILGGLEQEFGSMRQSLTDERVE
jgi:hypothetical protein